jgi:hypothetical protein
VGLKENNLHGHESRKNSQQQTSEYLSEKHVKPIYMKVITEENSGKIRKNQKNIESSSDESCGILLKNTSRKYVKSVQMSTLTSM